jgi:tRNA G18 (ribose-2'-O)-methylase SpoU
LSIINYELKKTSIIEMNRLSVEQFHEAAKMPLLVVLDDVRSLYNVGSVFRTSDAFRVEAIDLCGITATPDEVRDEDGTLVRDCTLKASQEIHKTALGAEESVAWRYYKTAAEAVAALKADGYTVLAVEQCHGSTMLNDFKPAFGDKKKYAVVLGNEVKGVHQEVVDMCDGCLEIPQYGTKHSLNVSVTAGIVIWHFASSNL